MHGRKRPWHPTERWASLKKGTLIVDLTVSPAASDWIRAGRLMDIIKNGKTEKERQEARKKLQEMEKPYYSRKVDMSGYKKQLIRRYWSYQKAAFPDAESHFDRLDAPIGSTRPPVFHKDKAWKNVIIRPGASKREIDQLISLIPKGKRHKWFHSMNSSQALAQSVFGNLATYDCLSNLKDLVDEDGMALLDDAQVRSDNFAMEFNVNYLGEPRPTSLDVYFKGDYQVAIECKFSESEIGTCSRPRLTPTKPNYDNEYCDGNYTKQRARIEQCSLTEIGVLYWRYVSQLFHWDGDNSYIPCPLYFNYQLVRNILAVGVGDDERASPATGHVVLIYDERNPAFQEGGKGFISFTDTQQALRDPTMLRKCSWQRIVQHMRNNNILSWLTEQLDLKYGF